MSEKSLTLLELHLGDGDVSIGPFGITGGTGGINGTDDALAIDGSDDTAADADTAADESGDRCGCSVKSIGGLLLALGVLAVVAIGVAALLGDDDAVEIDR